MEMAFGGAGRGGTIGATKKLVAIAQASGRAFAVVGTVRRARFRGTIVARPSLTFKGRNAAFHGVANTFTSRGIARTVFHNTGVTQFTFETHVTLAFAVFASTVVETIVSAIFHLTSFPRPIANAFTRAVDAFTVSILFMAIARAFWGTAIHSRPGGEAFHDVGVVDHAVAGANVFRVAGRTRPSIVAFANWFFWRMIQQTFTVFVASWMRQTNQCATIRTTKTGHARAGAVFAFAGTNVGIAIVQTTF
jgi:hypothetical protein